MKDWLDIVLKYLALITFIFTVYTHYEDVYLQNRKDSVEKAESYINTYANGDLQKDIKIIADFWMQVPEQLRDARSISLRDAYRIFQYIILSSNDYNQFKDSIDRVLLHFDMVSFCVEGDLCSKSIINRFYCKEYNSFRPVFKINEQYYNKEGISVGQSAMEYFDENCH